MISQNLGNLVVRLVGDSSKYIEMLQDASQATEENMRKIESAVVESMDRINKAILSSAIKSFGRFEVEMTKATSIMGVTTEQAKEMSRAVLDLSGKTLQGPEELARGYYYLASAGYTAAQAIKLIPVAAQFAVAGNFPLQKATEMLAGVQTAMGLKTGIIEQDVKNMQRLSDILIKTNTLAQTSAEELATAMSRAGGALRAFNVDAEEGAAILAALATQNIKANLAGNTLVRMYTLLAASARDAATAHKQFGISIFDETGQMRKMYKIFEDLERVTGGMSPEERAGFLAKIGIKPISQKFVLPLLGQSEFMRQAEEENRKAVEQQMTKTVAEKQMDTLFGTIERLGNTLKAFAIEIGASLAPAVEFVAKNIQMLIEGLRLLPDWFKDTIAYVASTVAVFYSFKMAISSITFIAPILIRSFAGMAGSITTFNGALLASPLSAWGGAITLVLGGTVALMYAVDALARSYYGLDKAIEENKRLQDELGKAYDKQTQKSLQEVYTTKDTEQTRKNLESQLIGIENNINTHKRIIDKATEEKEAAQKEMAQVGGFMALVTGGAPALGLALAPAAAFTAYHRYSDVQEANNKIEQSQKMIELFRKQREELKKGLGELGKLEEENLNLPKPIRDVVASLQEQIATFGMSATQIKLYKLELSGYSYEELALARILERTIRLKKEGEKLTKKYQSPEAKYVEKIDELNAMVSAGAITFDVYTNAVAAAQKELDKAGQMADKVHSKFEAAEVGSAEALQRYQEYLDAIRITSRPPAGVKVFGSPQDVPVGYRTQQEILDRQEALARQAARNAAYSAPVGSTAAQQSTNPLLTRAVTAGIQGAAAGAGGLPVKMEDSDRVTFSGMLEYLRQIAANTGGATPGVPTLIPAAINP